MKYWLLKCSVCLFVCYNYSCQTIWQNTNHDLFSLLQSQADTANLLIKNVYDPLVEVVHHKKSHQKKLYGFREAFDAEVAKSDDTLSEVRLPF